MAVANQESRAKKLATKSRARSTAGAPSFAAMSKMAFEVTHDDYIGFSPPLPHTPVRRTLKTKECPVCGEKASRKELTCRNCGAWFPKESG